tara:strand:- start:4491 stop:4772 length:282 start_codon:yes stop_codon:yes gene_type:complete
MKQANSNTETFSCDVDPRFGKTGRTWHGTAGTVIYQDGLSRWNRETTDGRERTFDTAAEAFSGVFAPVPPPAPHGFKYGSHAEYCEAMGWSVN